MMYDAPAIDLLNYAGALMHWTRILQLTTATATKLRLAATEPGLSRHERHDLIVCATTLEQLAATIRREFLANAA